MARNAGTNEDIPYKYAIDEIRLRVISNLQENYKIHEYSCIAIYRGS